jgi:hypothetical protein
MKSLLFIILYIKIYIALGGIVEFDEQKITFNEQTTHFYFAPLIGMFSSADAPAKFQPGNGISYVNMDHTYFRTSVEDQETLFLLVFHELDSPNFGHKKHNVIHYCCNPELISANICSTPNELIYGNLYASWVHQIEFSRGNLTTQFLWQQHILRSGMYGVALICCSSMSVGLNGQTIWMNPFGYLPGQYFGHIPFHASMATLYLGAFLVWLFLSIKYREELLFIQKCIGVIFFLGFFASLLFLFGLIGYNNYGKSLISALIWGIMTNSLKKAFCRALLLAVALGYLVITPVLRRKLLILFFMLSYLILSIFESVIVITEIDNQYEVYYLVFLHFPISLLNTIFYWWTFYALASTIKILNNTTKQTIKLNMYKNLFYILIITGICCAIYMAAELYFLLILIPNAWMYLWVWDDFWIAYYYAILVRIAIIWRPSHNNLRFSCKQTETQDTSQRSTLDSERAIDLQFIPTERIPHLQLMKELNEDDK